MYSDFIELTGSAQMNEYFALMTIKRCTDDVIAYCLVNMLFKYLAKRYKFIGTMFESALKYVWSERL